MHRSGSSEIRQICRKTARPFRLPTQNHTESAATHAKIAVTKDQNKESFPTAAKAPIPTKIGVVGNGTPTCSANTAPTKTQYPFAAKYSVNDLTLPVASILRPNLLPPIVPCA